MTRNLIQKKSLWLLIFLPIIFSGCQVANRLKLNSVPQETPITTNLVTSEKINLTATVSGQTALELLTANAKVESKKYDFGVFVESINGLKGNNEHFWALYVNNEKSQTGADTTILQAGDTTSWVFEKIEPMK